MRIGIDARFYGSLGKGLGRYTAKLIQYLEEQDAENEYVIFLSAENFDEFQPKNTRFQKVLCKIRWYSLAEQCLFPFLLLRFRLDLMHFPHFNVPLLYYRPFVVTIHDLILFHYPTLRGTTRSPLLYWIKFAAYRVVIASAIRRSQQVIAVSLFTAEDIRKHYRDASTKISLIYEAAEPFCFWAPEEKRDQIFRTINMISSESKEGARDIIKPYILYVGNAYPHKNLELFLETAALFPEYEFLLVGKMDYFYTRLKSEANRRGISNVHFIGFVDDSDLGMLYRNAKVYAFPSLYEGFGLPPLEASLYGVPVLAAACGSLPEILGTSARFFDPEEKGSFSIALRDLLEKREERERLIEAGYQNSTRFNWNQMAQETKSLYERCGAKQ